MIILLESDPLNFDGVIVNYETEILAGEIEAALTAYDPSIVIPEDTERKSVELEMIVEGNGETEEYKTEVTIKIEY